MATVRERQNARDNDLAEMHDKVNTIMEMIHEIQKLMEAQSERKTSTKAKKSS